MAGRPLAGTLAILTLVACGGGGSDTTTGPSGGPNSVTVGNNFYSPASLSVAVGTKVTWDWAQGDTEHMVTFDDNAPGSGRRSSGSFDRTFSAAGTYTYFCEVHGRAVMSGTVTVGGGSSSGGGGGGGGGGGTGGGGGYGMVRGAR